MGSRIRERDKKNAEYYVGDYYLKSRSCLNWVVFEVLESKYLTRLKEKNEKRKKQDWLGLIS